jgi:hypothetical protein
VDLWIHFFRWEFRFCPIKDPSFVRARSNTIPTANAPVVIHHDQAVRFFPSGMHWAYLHTRRVLTVLALDGHVNESRLRNLFGIVIMLGILQIDQGALLEPDDPNPVELRILTGIVIFIGTGIDASSTSDTARQVQTIAPEGVRERFLRADRKLLAVFLLVSQFPFGNESFLLLRRHLAKMLLEEVLLLLFRARKEGERNPCQGSKGKVTKQLSPGDFLISHVVYPSADGARVPVSSA